MWHAWKTREMHVRSEWGKVKKDITWRGWEDKIKMGYRKEDGMVQIGVIWPTLRKW